MITSQGPHIVCLCPNGAAAWTSGSKRQSFWTQHTSAPLDNSAHSLQLMVRSSSRRRSRGASSEDDWVPTFKFIVFRGNGSHYLNRAFERRFPRWQPALSSPRRSTRVCDAPLTKLQENLLLSRALLQGGVAFCFRDVFSGPQWETSNKGDQSEPVNLTSALLNDMSLKYKSSSLFSRAYPATADLQGKWPQVVNRWPHHAGLTSKDESLTSLERYYSMQGLSPWDYVPLSFIVPNCRLQGSVASSTAKWSCVRDAHESVGRGYDVRVPAEHSKMNMWLLKPSNGSGGDGIVITSEISELANALDTARASVHSFICQKYLEAPLLYHGRKFDLRVWAVLADDPKSPLGLRVYAFREGYARTSSEAYHLSTDAADITQPQVTTQSQPPHGVPGHAPELSSDAQAAAAAAVADAAAAAAARHRVIHLTNYCQQVRCANCSKFEEGNSVSFDDIQASIHPTSGLQFRQDVLPKIFGLVADAALAARSELLRGLHDYGNGRRVAALCGYDFMISENGQPFLIEVNANPLLAPQNEWHDQLVSRMIDDYVELAADGSFRTHEQRPCLSPASRPPLDGTHCKDFKGSGFLLLVGRPTGIHPTARFEVSALEDEKGEKTYVLDRTLPFKPDPTVMVEPETVDLVEAQPPPITKSAPEPIQVPNTHGEALIDAVPEAAPLGTPKPSDAPRWMTGTRSSESKLNRAGGAQMQNSPMAQKAQPRARTPKAVRVLRSDCKSPRL